MKPLILSLFSGIYLLTSANIASARSHDAFRALQERCIAFTETGDASVLRDLKKLPEEFRQAFIEKNNARSDTVLWYINSDSYLLVTYESQDNFCEVIGYGVEFDDLQKGFIEWQELHGDLFRSEGELELNSSKKANVFMARDLGSRGSQQVFVIYYQDLNGGLMI